VKGEPVFRQISFSDLNFNKISTPEHSASLVLEKKRWLTKQNGGSDQIGSNYGR
jgi:hypothetical protein